MGILNIAQALRGSARVALKQLPEVPEGLLGFLALDLQLKRVLDRDQRLQHNTDLRPRSRPDTPLEQNKTRSRQRGCQENCDMIPCPEWCQKNCDDMIPCPGWGGGRGSEGFRRAAASPGGPPGAAAGRFAAICAASHIPILVSSGLASYSSKRWLRPQ